MDGKQINAMINQLWNSKGQSGGATCLAGLPVRLMETKPRPSSQKIDCEVCGEVCWGEVDKFQKIAESNNAETYVFACFDCCNAAARYLAERGTPAHVAHNNQTDLDRNLTRNIEKQLAADVGATYEDPLQNN